ncbi:MAG: DUF4055 domain-containing protein, partial [Gemmatimonadetes bacterium]|nr:DUF4055 domain-containing protein [Gemmatimonadota bacterium]
MSNHTSDAKGTPSVLYDAMRPNWFAVTDLLEGTLRMRARGTMYLPKEPLEANKPFNRRLRRSFLFNGLKSGLQKIVSKPFSKATTLRKPEILPSDELRDLAKNVDGKNSDLTAFAREVFESMIALGHTFIFVDRTNVEGLRNDAGQVTKAAAAKAGVRTLWRHIRATDLFAWEWEDDEAGQRVLKEIRFREVRLIKRENGSFADEEREFIWIIKRTGEFEVWRANTEVRVLNSGFGWGSGSGSGQHNILSTYLATRPIEASTVDHVKYTKLVASGKADFPGGVLPLVALYSQKKSEMTSEPALIELAVTNLEHWQSSSDQRNILRFARQAQKVITGATGKDLNQDNMKSAVDNVMTLKSKDAKAFYLEHKGTGIEAGRTDLQDLEEKMRQQGMQPQMERTIDATATGTMVQVTNASTDVQAWIQELEAGLKKAYVISAAWVGLKIEDPKEEFGVEVFSDFSAPITGGKDFEQIAKARERGDLSQETTLAEMKRRGMLAESVDIQAEIERTNEEGLQADADEDFGATEAGPRVLAEGSSDHTHT